MPPRNNPLPAAVRLFNCAICDKGYPRQLDYENHLGSYDHNHRQRLADMKRLTASNDPESSKPKQGLDMRSINVEDANKKPGIGGRFTKIGGAAAQSAGGSRFKKVGVAVGAGAVAKDAAKDVGKESERKDVRETANKKEEETRIEDKVVPSIESVPPVKSGVVKLNEDTVMAEADEEETVTWEEYNFTKPTGCDHANCSGCKTEGIWSGEWLAVGTA